MLTDLLGTMSPEGRQLRYEDRKKMRIEKLYLFPVKSLAAVAVEELPLGECGPHWDREWMVVNESGVFVTQRELPRMALIRPELHPQDGTLRLHSPGMPPLEIPLARAPAEQEKKRAVKIWSSETMAIDEGEEPSSWLSQALEQNSLRLVRLGDHPIRKEGEHARSIRFTDDYPLHLVSLSSLQDLNKRLPAPMEALRFRPNILVSGTKAWEEDQWEAVGSDALELRVGRACTRCPITTVDPGSGERGPQPLKTLATFRRNSKNKVEFGLYLHSVPGAVLRIGQELNVLRTRSTET